MEDDPRICVEQALGLANAVVRRLRSATPTMRCNEVRRAVAGKAHKCDAAELALVAGLSAADRQAIRAGEEAKEAMPALYGGLCGSEAGRVVLAASRRSLSPPAQLIDDLMQEAWPMLLSAAASYDLARGTRFHTWAVKVIRQGLWEVVCRMRGVGSCGRDAGRTEEEGVESHFAVVTREADTGELVSGQDDDSIRLFIEAEALGRVIGADPRLVAAAYREGDAEQLAAMGKAVPRKVRRGMAQLKKARPS